MVMTYVGKKTLYKVCKWFNLSTEGGRRKLRPPPSLLRGNLQLVRTDPCYGLTCTPPDSIGICEKSSAPIDWQALGSTTLSKKTELIVSVPAPGSPLSKTVKKAASNSSLKTGSLVFLIEPPKLARFPTT